MTHLSAHCARKIDPPQLGQLAKGDKKNLSGFASIQCFFYTTALCPPNVPNGKRTHAFQRKPLKEALIIGLSETLSSFIWQGANFLHRVWTLSACPCGKK